MEHLGFNFFTERPEIKVFHNTYHYRCFCIGVSFYLLTHRIVYGPPKIPHHRFIDDDRINGIRRNACIKISSRDHLHPEQHPKIKAVKDCAAGAVLVASVAALGVAAAFVYDVLL